MNQDLFLVLFRAKSFKVIILFSCRQTDLMELDGI